MSYLKQLIINERDSWEEMGRRYSPPVGYCDECDSVGCVCTNSVGDITNDVGECEGKDA